MEKVPLEKKIVFDDDTPFFDQSKRAEAVLDHVLSEKVQEHLSGTHTKVDVNLALKARPILDIDTGRTMSRVLFVTSDVATLEKNSEAQDYYLKLADQFDEVHVLVILNGVGKDSYDRCLKNVWLYSLHVKHWYRIPFAARSAAKDAFVFNDTIRPDFVVGCDPYEAGLSAYFIANEFDRPLQLHVPEDFFHPQFLAKDISNKWRKRIAKYLLKRVDSVRTYTEDLREVLKSRYKKITDLQLLPRFYNFAGYRDMKPVFDVHKKYPEYVFMMLAFGPITADSHLHDLFSALRNTLINPRIGLIVIGEGPAKKLFAKKVELLGIEKNVVFISKTDDLFSYYKTADVLIETGTSQASENHILRAAAAELPIIAHETDLRKDLFTDGSSAFLCPVNDVYCLSQKLTKFINETPHRIQFAREARQIAEDRLLEDADTHYRALRDSIEVALFAGNSEDKGSTGTEKKATKKPLQKKEQLSKSSKKEKDGKTTTTRTDS